ncbi:CoA transferase [Sphingosinicella sp. LHD-64]|uniref:CaiB/BaiF CoA transferase family protein n=1 Tax=Sphingosinicella sp. LHD-64 TaxID=3072139 RepID=UPI00280C6A9B|nr:CoA transferase [Sphingosinicella sp. LHD-64]MDQ8757604.1 CoA transferase [Sphingosinicella sp. LHD-64]
MRHFEAGQQPEAGVLHGIRVLDFGRYVAGPYCATVLADFGADVIRIERRGGGEDRAIVPVTPEGEGAIFLQINRNKRSVTLDPRHPDGSVLLRRLVAGADVVVANLPVPSLAAMGLDYPSLKALRADIILANVSSFGPDGPWAGRGGFDSIGQAMCGAAFLSGQPGRPMRTPITWVDHAAGLHAAIGVMIALFARQQAGEGQEVQASLLGSALAFGATWLIEEAITGIGRQATGNRSFVNGPTDMFETMDGWIVTQVVGDALFGRWVSVIEEPQWLGDSRFATDELRGINGALLSARMARWCRTRTSRAVLDALGQAGIPAGPILSPAEANAHPQVHALGLTENVPCPGLEAGAPLMRFPVAMHANPDNIRRAPPTPGQHNEEILGELGYSAADIIRLAESGAI